MPHDLANALIVGATALLAALLTRLPHFFRDGRASLSKDLEIYNALPAESTQRLQLLARIDEQLSALDARRSARRDWRGVAGSAFLIVSGLVFALGAMGVGGGWLFTFPLIGFVVALGFLGLNQSFPRVVRDARGNPVPGVHSAKA